MSRRTPVAYRPVRERLTNLYWEYRLGIATRGIVSVDHPDSTHYASAGYRAVRRVLDHLAPGPSDTFVDIGCGKGRILCCAARYPCRRVIGVDLSAELCAQARANVARMRGRRAPVTVHEGYADAFDYRDVSVCYLFAPFGAATLDRVLTRIRGDLGDGALRMAFHNLNPQQEAVFAAHRWLDRYAYWPAGTRAGEHPVAFYRAS